MKHPTFDWIAVVARLEEVLRLADIGYRYERAVDAACEGEEVPMPVRLYSDRFRLPIRLTPLEHQSAGKGLLPDSTHQSTNHHERNPDQPGAKLDRQGATRPVRKAMQGNRARGRIPHDLG